MPDNETLAWAVAGTYFEACNCLPICPCRQVGDRDGGHSSFGVCDFAIRPCLLAHRPDSRGRAVLSPWRHVDAERRRTTGQRRRWFGDEPREALSALLSLPVVPLGREVVADASVVCGLRFEEFEHAGVFDPLVAVADA